MFDWRFFLPWKWKRRWTTHTSVSEKKGGLEWWVKRVFRAFTFSFCFFGGGGGGGGGGGMGMGMISRVYIKQLLYAVVVVAKHRQIHKIEPSIVWPLVLPLLICPVIFPIFEASFLHPMPLISTLLTPLLRCCYYSCRFLLLRRRFSSSSSPCHFYLCPDPEALSSSCYIWSRKRYRVTWVKVNKHGKKQNLNQTPNRKSHCRSG